MTFNELESVIHEGITEDMEAWRETFEIMADKKLMRQIKQADLDWASGAKDSYVSWDELTNA
jgi:hypothetical protein